MYSYEDLNDYIHQFMEQKGHKSGNNFIINFVLSSYRVVIKISNNYRLDLRGTQFGDLIGFEKKIITKTEFSSRLPNITNNIDVVNIHCDMIIDSIFDGRFSNTLAVIPTDNLTRSFSFEPRRALFGPVSKSIVSEIQIYVTDSLGRPINLNGINWFMSLIFRSTLM